MRSHLLWRWKRKKLRQPSVWQSVPVAVIKGTHCPVSKTDHSGEVLALQSLSGITVMPCEKSFGFFTKMTDEQKKEARVYYSSLLDRVLEKAAREPFDLLVLDEIMAVCNYGLVDEEKVLQFISGRPEKLEVVLTGRNPSDQLLAQADYVSEIKKIRHPYDQGINARRGIEY